MAKMRRPKTVRFITTAMKMERPIATHTPAGSGQNCPGLLRDSADHAHHAERDDERILPQPRNERAVHAADECARENRDHPRGERRVLGVQRLREEDAAHRDRRADAEVYAAAHEDQNHPERADGYDGRLREIFFPRAAGDE